MYPSMSRRCIGKVWNNRRVGSALATARYAAVLLAVAAFAASCGNEGVTPSSLDIDSVDSTTAVKGHLECQVTPSSVPPGESFVLSAMGLKRTTTYTVRFTEGDYSEEVRQVSNGDGRFELTQQAHVAGLGLVDLLAEVRGSMQRITGCSYRVAAADVCGDGQCTGQETCDTCAADCRACSMCGDNVCDSSESCDTCPADCGACSSGGSGSSGTGASLAASIDKTVIQLGYPYFVDTSFPNIMYSLPTDNGGMVFTWTRQTVDPSAPDTKDAMITMVDANGKKTKEIVIPVDAGYSGIIGLARTDTGFAALVDSDYPTYGTDPQTADVISLIQFDGAGNVTSNKVLFAPTCNRATEVGCTWYTANYNSGNLIWLGDRFAAYLTITRTASDLTWHQSDAVRFFDKNGTLTGGMDKFCAHSLGTSLVSNGNYIGIACHADTLPLPGLAFYVTSSPYDSAWGGSSGFPTLNGGEETLAESNWQQALLGELVPSGTGFWLPSGSLQSGRNYRDYKLLHFTVNGPTSVVVNKKIWLTNTSDISETGVQLVDFEGGYLAGWSERWVGDSSGSYPTYDATQPSKMVRLDRDGNMIGEPEIVGASWGAAREEIGTTWFNYSNGDVGWAWQGDLAPVRYCYTYNGVQICTTTQRVDQIQLYRVRSSSP